MTTSEPFRVFTETTTFNGCLETERTFLFSDQSQDKATAWAAGYVVGKGLTRRSRAKVIVRTSDGVTVYLAN